MDVTGIQGTGRPGVNLPRHRGTPNCEIYWRETACRTEDALSSAIAQGQPTFAAGEEARLYAMATQMQSAGRLAEAKSTCERLIAMAPRHADGLQLLGVIHAQGG